MTLLDRDAAAPPLPGELPPARQVGLARLRSTGSRWAVAAAGVAAVGQTGGTVIAGRLAEEPTALLVILLAVAVVGAALLDTAARTVWWAVVDRAEGRLRADLLVAALQQPLSVLSEQAVGEVLDRVDDHTHERRGRSSLWGRGPSWRRSGTTSRARPQTSCSSTSHTWSGEGIAARDRASRCADSR